MRDYERAIYELPTNAVAYTNLCFDRNALNQYGAVAQIALTSILTCDGCILGDDSGMMSFGWLMEALKKQEGENSVQVLIQLAELQPDSAALRWCAGSVYEGRKCRQEALRQFEMSLNINARFFLALYDLGRVNHQLGNFRDALRIYKEALDAAPADALGIRLESKIKSFITAVQQELKMR